MGIELVKKTGSISLTAPSNTADLSNYYTKPEVDALIPDVSGFITEIPEEYVTEEELNAKGYLTEHQSLEGYAKTTDIPDVSGFALKSEIPSIEGLATEDYVEERIAAIPEVDLSGYAKTSDIPDVSGFISEIPSEYVTEEELNTAISGIDTGTEEVYINPDAPTDENIKIWIDTDAPSSFYTKEEVDALIPTVPTKTSEIENDSGYITSADIPEIDLSSYALKSEIPDVSGFITSIPDEYITETELDAKGYLTEHQSLANYYTKTEVNNLVGNIDTLLDSINGEVI